jgi:hypothetical protein
MLGLGACAGSSLRTETARSTIKSRDAERGGVGRFKDHLTAIFERFERGEMTQPELTTELALLLQDLELEPDVLEDWSRQGPDVEGIGRNGYRLLHSVPLSFGDREGEGQAILFYTPAGTSNPPHEHHNLMSTKRVLKGSYHLREYERVRKVEPGVVALRQVSDRRDVNFHSECVNMRDGYRAAHWFGSSGEPVLALNIAVKNPYRPEETFHGPQDERGPGRYFIDPTAGQLDDGLILARNISGEEAQAFTTRLLSDFPSHMPA